jgi:ribonucleoside-diphosphate reductase alpha chain
MGATHAEKSTVKSGQLNAVSSGASGGGDSASAMAPARPIAVAAVAEDPATDIKFCAIDNPDCEACQ